MNQVSAEDASNPCIDETNIPIGCTDDNYIEYNSDANVSNQNLCLTLVVLGCTDFNAANFDPLANQDDGSCILIYIWMVDVEAPITILSQIQMMELVNMRYLDVLIPIIWNMTNATEDDGSWDILIVYGCLEALASNYNSLANTSMEAVYSGCIDELADNYDPNATEDDGSCIYNGCTNLSACNYNIIANQDDGSCNYPDQYYDCDGNCLNDIDGDSVCDELRLRM